MCWLSYTSVRYFLVVPYLATDSKFPAGAETVRFFFLSGPPSHELLTQWEYP